MKNIFILFLSTALLGCAKKYGCTTLIKNSNYPPKSITLTKNPNYIPPKNYICRGNGHVEKIDSNKMLIRVNGVVKMIPEFAQLQNILLLMVAFPKL